MTPFTDAVNPAGAGGSWQPVRLLIVISFEGALVPTEFLERTRTKYVPFGVPAAIKVVSVLPVSNTRMFVAPGAVPASITYEVGGEPVLGAFQLSVVAKLDTVPIRPVGGPGKLLFEAEVRIAVNSAWSLQSDP
jgi:hypothetical protein